MEWRPVKGFDGIYEVSDSGQVRSLDRINTVCNKGKVYSTKIKGRMMSQVENANGYKRVYFSKNGDRVSFLVHRIVAEAFINNPNNYPQINHIDGDKSNNSVGNLEWCDNKYNARYTVDVLHEVQTYKRRRVYAKNMKSGVILKFDSVIECANHFGVKAYSISHRLHNKVNNPSINKASKLYDWYFYSDMDIPDTTIVKLDKNLDYIEEYDSAYKASIKTGICKKSILSAINNKKGYKTAGGFIWMKKDDYDMYKVTQYCTKVYAALLNTFLDMMERMKLYGPELIRSIV